MTLDTITNELLQQLNDPAVSRPEALETLLDSVLSNCLGWRRRATDGLSLLREDIGRATYFAVGILHVIDDLSRQPVMIDFAWSTDPVSLKRGIVRLGMVANSSGKYASSDRAETALLAFPRETALDLPWQHSLYWADSEWHSETSGNRRS